MPAEQSTWVSDAVKNFLHRLLFFLPQDSAQSADGFPIRKLGHYTEFLLLGLTLTALLLQKGELRAIWSRALLFGLLAALTDETIQVFVPGRGPAVTDVWIDFAGISTGFLAAAWIHRRILCKIKRKPD